MSGFTGLSFSDLSKFNNILDYDGGVDFVYISNGIMYAFFNNYPAKSAS